MVTLTVNIMATPMVTLVVTLMVALAVTLMVTLLVHGYRRSFKTSEGKKEHFSLHLLRPTSRGLTFEVVPQGNHVSSL